MDLVGYAPLRQGPASAGHGHRPRRGAGQVSQGEGRHGLQRELSPYAKELCHPERSLPVRSRTGNESKDLLSAEGDTVVDRDFLTRSLTAFDLHNAECLPRTKPEKPSSN